MSRIKLLSCLGPVHSISRNQMTLATHRTPSPEITGSIRKKSNYLQSSKFCKFVIQIFSTGLNASQNPVLGINWFSEELNSFISLSWKATHWSLFTCWRFTEPQSCLDSKSGQVYQSKADSWASLVAPMQRISLQGRRPEFHPWVEKIPGEGKRQPTPAFLPGEAHGQRCLVGHS